jgi:hypothetical protein
MRARGRLPPKDPHQIDAAFPDVPEAFTATSGCFGSTNCRASVEMTGFPEATIHLLWRLVRTLAPQVHFIDCLAAAVYPHMSPTCEQQAVVMGTTFLQETHPESAGENVSKLFSRPVKHSPSTPQEPLPWCGYQSVSRRDRDHRWSANVIECGKNYCTTTARRNESAG